MHNLETLKDWSRIPKLQSIRRIRWPASGLGFKHLKAKSFAQVQIFQVVKIKAPDFHLICERAQPQHMIFPKLVFRSFNMKFADQVDLTKVVFAVGKGTLFVSQALPPLQIRIPEVSPKTCQEKKTG